MIDPTLSLALAMHSTKGAYAVLLGSGVSSAAGILTGWGITLDLIEKLSLLAGEPAEPDPETWYQNKFGQPPAYDKLLDAIAKSPTERKQLLRSYFEPTEEDREAGQKIPTSAHEAIARLAAKGYIRVIITTNFDRLMEHALEAVGVVPTIISTPDALKGALPVMFSQCTIVKVHGDYDDTRIKNTPDELASYDPEIDGFLGRIFDEFGVITSGWSADWDVALVAAILRAPNRRFTTFFSTRGPLGDKAKLVVDNRHGETIGISSANDFFVKLEEQVASLDDIGQPHPLAPVVAAATVKRYLVDDRFRIRLHNLVTDETENAYRQLIDSRFDTNTPLTGDALVQRAKQYEAIIKTLQAMLIEGCRWGAPQYDSLWSSTLERIANPETEASGSLVWPAFRRYPALLLMYSGGIAAIAGNEWHALKALLVDTQVRVLQQWTGKTSQLAAWGLEAYYIAYQRKYSQPLTQRNDTQIVPVSEYIFTILREPLRQYIPADRQYDALFDRLEYFIALAAIDSNFEPDHEGAAQGPVGRFIYRLASPTISEILRNEADAAGANWGPLRGGLFGGSIERFHTLNNALATFVRRDARAFKRPD